MEFSIIFSSQKRLRYKILSKKVSLFYSLHSTQLTLSLSFVFYAAAFTLFHYHDHDQEITREVCRNPKRRGRRRREKEGEKYKCIYAVWTKQHKRENKMGRNRERKKWCCRRRSRVTVQFRVLSSLFNVKVYTLLVWKMQYKIAWLTFLFGVRTKIKGMLESHVWILLDFSLLLSLFTTKWIIYGETSTFRLFLGEIIILACLESFVSWLVFLYNK